jgi:hypothetical protein
VSEILTEQLKNGEHRSTYTRSKLRYPSLIFYVLQNYRQQLLKAGVFTDAEFHKVFAGWREITAINVRLLRYGLN